VFEIVINQERCAVGSSTVHDSDFFVCGHVGVLPVGLNDPIAFGICVNEVVDGAVVLYGRR
jgi:hypothetical protein